MSELWFIGQGCRLPLNRVYDCRVTRIIYTSTQTFNFDAHVREQSFMTYNKLSASCSGDHFLLALARENGTRARGCQMRSVETHNKVRPCLLPFTVQHQSFHSKHVEMNTMDTLWRGRRKARHDYSLPRQSLA
jgi:hypothetical protein